MARPRKPWFRTATKTWYVEVDGVQVKLAVGRENRAQAETEFHRLMAERGANAPLDVGKDRLTVVALCDGYLDHHEKKLAPLTWYEQKRILGRYAQ